MSCSDRVGAFPVGGWCLRLTSFFLCPRINNQLVIPSMSGKSTIQLRPRNCLPTLRPVGRSSVSPLSVTNTRASPRGAKCEDEDRYVLEDWILELAFLTCNSFFASASPSYAYLEFQVGGAHSTQEHSFWPDERWTRRFMSSLRFCTFHHWPFRMLCVLCKLVGASTPKRLSHFNSCCCFVCHVFYLDSFSHVFQQCNYRRKPLSRMPSSWTGRNSRVATSRSLTNASTWRDSTTSKKEVVEDMVVGEEEEAVVVEASAAEAVDSVEAEVDVASEVVGVVPTTPTRDEEEVC